MNVPASTGHCAARDVAARMHATAGPTCSREGGVLDWIGIRHSCVGLRDGYCEPAGADKIWNAKSVFVLN